MGEKTNADFESILEPEDNGKQNPNESYADKDQKHVGLSYDYKLVCVDDNFINGLIKENKYYVNTVLIWWKKHFNKKPVVAKEDDEDFEKSWTYDVYLEGDVKLRDHCHITGK